MVEYLVGAAFLGGLAYLGWSIYKFLQDFCDWCNGEEERLARFAVDQGLVDKEKPWPIRMVKWSDGVKLIAKLSALDVRYGSKVVGTFQGWKIYETVFVEGEEYKFEAVEPKQLAPERHDDEVLVLAPGLIYRPVKD